MYIFQNSFSLITIHNFKKEKRYVSSGIRTSTVRGCIAYKADVLSITPLGPTVQSWVRFRYLTIEEIGLSSISQERLGRFLHCWYRSMQNCNI